MPYHLDTYEKGFQVFELLKPFDMAVGVGFEPTEGINPQRFSRPPLSTTQPAHRKTLLLAATPYGEAGEIIPLWKLCTRAGKPLVH